MTKASTSLFKKLIILEHLQHNVTTHINLEYEVFIGYVSWDCWNFLCRFTVSIELYIWNLALNDNKILNETINCLSSPHVKMVIISYYGAEAPIWYVL